MELVTIQENELFIEKAYNGSSSSPNVIDVSQRGEKPNESFYTSEEVSASKENPYTVCVMDTEGGGEVIQEITFFTDFVKHFDDTYGGMSYVEIDNVFYSVYLLTGAEAMSNQVHPDLFDDLETGDPEMDERNRMNFKLNVEKYNEVCF